MMSIQQSNTDLGSAGRFSICARSFLHWLILVIGPLVTFDLWYLSNVDITSSAQERFDIRIIHEGTRLPEVDLFQVVNQIVAGRAHDLPIRILDGDSSESLPLRALTQ
jgi:hypothetical protein